MRKILKKIFGVILASATIITSVPVYEDFASVYADAASRVVEKDIYYAYSDYLDSSILKKYGKVLDQMESITYSKSSFSTGLSAFKSNLINGPADTLKKVFFSDTDVEENEVYKELAVKYLEDMMGDSQISKLYSSLSSTESKYSDLKDAFSAGDSILSEESTREKLAGKLSNISNGYWSKQESLDMINTCNSWDGLSEINSATGKALSKTKIIMSLYMMMLIQRDYIETSERLIDNDTNLYKGLSAIDNDQKSGFLVTAMKEMLKNDVLKKYSSFRGFISLCG